MWAAQVLTLRDKENQSHSHLDQLNVSDKGQSMKKCHATMISCPTLSEQDVLNMCFCNDHLITHNSSNQYFHLRRLPN